MIGGEFSAVNENKNVRFYILKIRFYNVKQQMISLLTTTALSHTFFQQAFEILFIVGSAVDESRIQMQ